MSVDAGHIPGPASIFLELVEQTRSTSVLFSGDLGNAGRFLLRSHATPPRAQNVVMETTYGDRLHKPLGPSIDEFFSAIAETFKRGGNVIIPTFALERAQELIYFLGQGIAQRRLSKSTQVYLDSPMAISATEIFRRHPECLEPATAKLFEGGQDPLDLPGLHFTRESAESIAINNVHGGAIIMAGSGMCTGGPRAPPSSAQSGSRGLEHRVRRLRSRERSRSNEVVYKPVRGFVKSGRMLSGLDLRQSIQNRLLCRINGAFRCTRALVRKGSVLAGSKTDVDLPA